MEVIISRLFFEQLDKCPIAFQKDFRKIYQQLKIVDHPTEIKGIKKFSTNKDFFTLHIENSRISLKQNKRTIIVACFLYNAYFNK